MDREERGDRYVWPVEEGAVRYSGSYDGNLIRSFGKRLKFLFSGPETAKYRQGELKSEHPKSEFFFLTWLLVIRAFVRIEIGFQCLGYIRFYPSNDFKVYKALDFDLGRMERW